MGNSSSSSLLNTLTEKNELTKKIDYIASKYILNQTFNDMNNLTDTGKCNEFVVLTSKLIKNNLNNLEQKELVARVENKPQEEAERDIKPQPIKNDIPKSINNLRDDANANAINADINANAININEIKKKEDQPDFFAQQGGDENDNSTNEDCIKIAKFYVKIAHLYAAIMKTINPIIFTTDRNGKINQYDLSTKDSIPSDEEIKNVKNNNFCSKRLDALMQKNNINIVNEKNKTLTITPKICSMNYDENKKTQQQFYVDKSIIKGGEMQAQVQQAQIKQAPAQVQQAPAQVQQQKIIDNSSEIGIPELIELYYDTIDKETGKPTMSQKMKEEYAKDVDTFYKAFTGKDNVVENGIKKITRFDQIPMRDFHSNPDCKPDGIYTKTYEGPLSNNLFMKYAEHFIKMVKRIDTTEQKLLVILNKIFMYTKQDGTTIEKITIRPELKDDDNFQSLINTTRKLIVELYIGCESDYLDGIKLIEGIISSKLAINNKLNLERELDLTINNYLAKN